MLNGRPYYLRLVLDQGYWHDSLMTAPDDEALRRSDRTPKFPIEAIRAATLSGGLCTPTSC